MVCTGVVDLFGKTTACDLVALMNRVNIRDEQGYNYMVVSRADKGRYPIMIIYFR